jgi:hypothetical protein
VIDLPRQHRRRGGEGQRFLSASPPRRHEEVLIAEFIRASDDPRAMLEAAAQRAIRHTEEFIIVAAQRREPRDLHARIRRANGWSWGWLRHPNLLGSDAMEGGRRQSNNPIALQSASLGTQR